MKWSQSCTVSSHSNLQTKWDRYWVHVCTDGGCPCSHDVPVEGHQYSCSNGTLRPLPPIGFRAHLISARDGKQAPAGHDRRCGGSQFQVGTSAVLVFVLLCTITVKAHTYSLEPPQQQTCNRRHEMMLKDKFWSLFYDDSKCSVQRMNGRNENQNKCPQDKGNTVHQNQTMYSLTHVTWKLRLNLWGYEV